MWNFWSIFHFYIDSREDTPEDGSSEGRKTVTSTIKFRPTSRDNLASYACEAQHPALDSPQRVEVFLSVMCKYKVYGEYYYIFFLLHISQHFTISKNGFPTTTLSYFLKQPDLLKISWIFLSYPLVDCFEFRACLLGRCFSSQNIKKQIFI